LSSIFLILVKGHDKMNDKTTNRVGLYIQQETRDRLNAFKERVGTKKVSHVSQDDAINYLLDMVESTPGKTALAPSPVAPSTNKAMGERVRRLREGQGWTLDELVVRLAEVGVETSNAGLSKIERDHVIPGSDKVAGLARVFGVSADYLLLLTDDPTPAR
jgi:ribosome-binding protein aMBF1 (putative translation factor)